MASKSLIGPFIKDVSYILKKIIQPIIFRALAALVCDRSTKKVIWIVLVKLCVCAACASVAVPHNN